MHAVSSFVLAVACMAAGLALAALGAGLVLDDGDRDDVMDRRPPINRDQFDTGASDLSHHARAGEPLVTQHRITAVISVPPMPSATTGAPKSPLYPRNGVTLWDRIRVSSKRDRSAFLLGTAIQIHAPEAAATPGPGFDPPPCCPRT